jgi:hypothetical protein
MDLWAFIKFAVSLIFGKDVSDPEEDDLLIDSDALDSHSRENR